MRRILMLMCLVLAVPAAAPAGAHQHGNIISGNFIGMRYAQDGVGRVIDGLSNTVLPGERRRFSGEYADDDITCSVEGTHAVSDQTSATGICSNNSRIDLQGMAIPFEEGDVDAADFVIWSQTLRTTSRGGGDDSEAVFLRDLGGSTEAAAGPWEGRGIEEGSGSEVVITADFSAGEPGDVGEGTMTIVGKKILLKVLYSVERPRDPGSSSDFVLVGASENGELAYLIGKLTPGDDETSGAIQGTLTVLQAGPGASQSIEQIISLGQTLS